MAYLKTGTKPPVGAQISYGHSLGHGLYAAYLFNEGGGVPVDSVNNRKVTVTGPAWSDGNKLKWGADTDYLETILRFGAVSQGTIVWRVRRSAAFNNGAVNFDWGQDGGNSPEFSAQKYSDGNWYVGWNGASDKRVTLAASAADYSQNKWATFAFTWGADGSFLYKDGLLLGSNATANPAETVSFDMRIGANVFGTQSIGSGSYYDAWYAWSRVLTVEELQTLSIDPYCFFVQPSYFRKLFSATVAATSIPNKQYFYKQAVNRASTY